MRIISMMSSRPGIGQTTIAVHLATGLVRKGYRVLFCNLNTHNRVYAWLGLDSDIQTHELNWHNPAIDLNKEIYPCWMGIDVLYPGSDSRVGMLRNESLWGEIRALPYDYFILNPGGQMEDLMIAGLLADNVIACTDLKNEDELHRLSLLQNELERISNAERGINLILPSKVRTGEWDHNSTMLFLMADHFGYEKIGELLPYCERIHDLPQSQRHAWQLHQQNIRDAFDRLVDRVEGF